MRMQRVLQRQQHIAGGTIAATPGTAKQHRQAQGGQQRTGQQMQRKGQRIISFSSEVADWPGVYHLYEPINELGDTYDGDKAWSRMADAAGAAYNTPGLALIFARRI